MLRPHKTKIMSLRMTPGAWEALEAVSLAEGHRTPSGYVRSLIVANTETLTPPPATPPAPKKKIPGRGRSSKTRSTRRKPTRLRRGSKKTAARSKR